MADVSEDNRGTEGLQYVAWHENNHKENECWITFLQWTGNEAELRKLEKSLREAKKVWPYCHGDFSEFHLDYDTLLTHAEVKKFCRLFAGKNCRPIFYTSMFSRINGRFLCPPEALKPHDPELLNGYSYSGCPPMDVFYSCGIEDHFHPPGPETVPQLWQSTDVIAWLHHKFRYKRTSFDLNFWEHINGKVLLEATKPFLLALHPTDRDLAADVFVAIQSLKGPGKPSPLCASLTGGGSLAACDAQRSPSEPSPSSSPE